MITTTFAVSYLAFSREKGERELADLQNVDSVRILADSESADIRTLVAEAHTEVIDSIVIGDSKEERLDTIAEGILHAILAERITLHLLEFNATTDRCKACLVDLRIDSSPLCAAIPGPVPDPNDPGINGSGCTNYSDICEVLGVRSEIMAKVRFEGKGIDLEREIRVSAQRRSLSELSRSRLDRAAAELSSGELHRVAGYLISSYAQQKVMMGYGEEKQSAYDPLLSEEEISSLVDLAVGTVTGSHLLTSDPSFLKNVSGSLDDLPVSGGCQMELASVLNGSADPVDMVSALILSTGIMSEGNEPSLPDLIRPIFQFVVDLLVNRFVSYLGINGMEVQNILLSVENARKALEEDILSWIGLEIKNEGLENAYDLFINAVSRSGIDVSHGFYLMERTYGDLLYDGQRLTSYPSIDPGLVFSNFSVLISVDDDAHRMYKDQDGKVHPGTDPRPGDRLYGFACNEYSVEAEFSLDALECQFQRIKLATNEFKEELVRTFGELKSRVDDFLDQAQTVAWNALERTLQRIELEGSQLFKGWNLTDHPSINDDDPPVLSMLQRVRDALGSIIVPLSKEICSSLDLSTFGSDLGGYESDLGDSIARWLNDTYENLIDADELISKALNHATERFLDDCEIAIKGIEFVGSKITMGPGIVFHPDWMDDTTCISERRSLLIDLGLKRSGVFAGMVLPRLRNGIRDAISEMQRREVGIDGIVTNALTGSPTRGSDLLKSITDLGWEKVKSLLEEFILPVIDSIAERIHLGYGIAGTRALMPPTTLPDGTIEPRSWGEDNSSFGRIQADMRIEGMSDPLITVDMGEGVKEINPESVKPPFESYVSIKYNRTFRMEYSLRGGSYPSISESSTEVQVVLDLLISLDGTYPLAQCEYEDTASMWDYATELTLSTVESAARILTDQSSGMLGGSLSSLSELPPLVTDFIKGKDLDLAEVARVLTNITMDLSSTLRDAVKDLIQSIVSGAISWGLKELTELFDIEVINLTFNVGPLGLNLVSETKALRGESGRILVLIFNVPTMGMHGFFGLTRNGSEESFNGTVEMEKGPLYLRMELDPFLKVRDSIISIEGRYRSGSEDVRVSIKAPEKVEYRSSEITLESVLGVEPSVFIAPIGTSVMFDGGFRIKYRTPDELEPHINELNFSASNLTHLEIFNPGKNQLAGYTLEFGPVGSAIVAKHSLNRVTRDRFVQFELGKSTLSKWSGSISAGTSLVVVLRDNSGEIEDRVVVKDFKASCYSRDADGYGVFRWGNGTLGWSNGAMTTFSFTSLLISLVKASIAEAWNESQQMYGLSFETIVHFIQKAMDYFVERVCSAIAELIIDVRIFLSMKIALGTGASAGIGVELAFIAEGDAIAEFIQWIYDNIKVLVSKIFDPHGAGDFRAFPMTILEKCHIEAVIYQEVSTPPAVSKMAPKGTEIPSELTLAVAGRINIALPFRLLGKDIGNWKVGAGIFVMDAPNALVSLFYDLDSTETTIELWLLHVTIWSEDVLI